MRALRELLVLLLAILATTQAFMIDGDEYSGLVDYPLPKRNFQHIWRNIQMQMPELEPMPTIVLADAHKRQCRKFWGFD
ncbi:hypothetical protein RB195_018107 [Necator americanus]|uniref:Uncharacterized protein n=1 Tax=Necator americanus TaxID=51031 RepID=A0ABR1CBT7_NECAM